MCQQRPDELVIDVTGRTRGDADPLSDDLDLLPSDDVTFVHVSDVRGLLASAGDDDVSEVLPLVVYVRGNETAPGRIVVQLLPSLKSLDGNEACRIGSRDAAVQSTFALEQSDHLNSVIFTRAVPDLHERYQLSIICQQIHAADPSTFTFYLHVQLI